MTGPAVLVALDEVYSHLNVPTEDMTSDMDAKLQGFIDAATAFIQAQTGPIVPQTYREVHNGGNSTICLFNPPILSIQSVIEYVALTGYVLTETDLTTSVGQYAYSLDDPQSGVIRRRYSANIVGQFAGGDHNIVVQYTGGQSTVPPDVKLAVLQDIAGLYGPSQQGVNPYANEANLGNGPLNPIGLFPRVAAILSAAALRTPAIA